MLTHGYTGDPDLSLRGDWFSEHELYELYEYRLSRRKFVRFVRLLRSSWVFDKSRVHL